MDCGLWDLLVPPTSRPVGPLSIPLYSTYDILMSMTEKEVKSMSALTYDFALYINKSTKVDEMTGGLVCKMCGSPVNVDYFEKSIECTGCDEL